MHRPLLRLLLLVLAGLLPVTTLAQAPGSDVSITVTDGVASVVPGTAVTYTVVVTNAGPDVGPATVSDNLPVGLTGATWTCVASGGAICPPGGTGNLSDLPLLVPGGTVTYTLSATVSPSLTGTLTNTATVTLSPPFIDPNPANNAATDSDVLTPQADLAITVTDGVASATPGSPVTYTITASNAGPSDAPASTVSDILPGVLGGATWTCAGAGGGSCTASGSGNIADTVNLPAGASVTYTLTATVAAGATGSLANTATVTTAAGVADLNPGNDGATDTDALAAPPPPPAVMPVPALSDYGVALLALLLALAGLRARAR